jgi:hypothetical protein
MSLLENYEGEQVRKVVYVQCTVASFVTKITVKKWHSPSLAEVLVGTDGSGDFPAVLPPILLLLLLLLLLHVLLSLNEDDATCIPC